MTNTTFKNLTNEQLKQFLAEKFPNEKFTYELFIQYYNAKEIDDEKMKLISIPFYAEIYFENDELDTEIVEFELINTNDITFDDETALDEYVDNIAIELNEQ